MALSPRPNRPLQAIAFDLDGTLASSEDVYLQVGTETLRRRGKTFDDDLRHAMMGRPAADALEVMIQWHQLKETAEELLAESEQIFWEIAAKELRTMPGATELLDWLDGHELPRGIVTSGHRKYAERILELLDLADRFAFLITADDIEQGKPAPEPYLLAAEQFGVAASEMMVLEDSHVGSQSGVAAGAFTIALPNAHTAGHAFDGVAFVAETLADPRIRQAIAPQSAG
ncbi:MAG: HAD family phosphatase [Planctomycetota bacterium]